MTKKAKRNILNISFLLLLIGITLTILLTCNRELNFENIKGFLKSSNPWFIAVILLCMILSIAFEGWSMHLIVRRLGYRPKIRSSMAYAAADVYYSAITPSASGGQPASAFYMMRDGISAGVTSFGLLFNLISYTASIFIIGILGFALNPSLLWQFKGFVQFLVILGIVLQVLLLAFFIACICWHKGVLKLGNGVITLLTKMHIVKKTEKWREKLKVEVEKYHQSFREIRKHPTLFFEALALNTAQRIAQLLIPSFVCLAASPETDFGLLFSMQALVLLGYNSIPLPGGVGAYEYLYLNIYAAAFGNAFILSAMMIERAVSYYLRTAVSGVYMLGYHAAGMRNKKNKQEPPADTAAEETPDDGENTEESKGEHQDENNVQ